MHKSGCLAFTDDKKSLKRNEVMKIAMLYSKDCNALIMNYPNEDSISNQGYMQQVGSGYNVVYSPHKLFYENTLRSNHKKNNDSANNVLSAILINHAVSVLDIILRNTNISVSTESNYNAVNQFGINKINLSIGLN